MRTLSRPMFNMGGPIKEGVMHGIREPYKGGQLVRPGPGRPGYQGEINPQAWHKQPLKKIVDTTKTISQEAAKKANMFKRAGSFFTKGITGPAISEAGIMQMAKNLMGWRPKGIPFQKQILGLGSRFPKTGPILPVWGAIEAQKAISNITQPAEQALSLQLQEAGALDPTSPNFGGQFINTGAATRLAGLEQERLDELNKKIDPSTVTPERDTGSDYGQFDRAQKRIAEGKATDLAKAAKDKRVNELLEIMGYDKARKGAAYDALIDASQIISQAPGGKDLDISRDIIQPAIATTSKRFDKPREIEEAVRLMQTKADIQKDLTKDETALANELKREQIKVAKKTLAGGTIQEAVLEQTLKQGAPTGSTLSQIARAKGLDNTVLPIKIPKNQDTLEVATEVIQETWKNAVEEPDKVVKPGVYVVKDRIIIVDEDGSIKPYL